MTLQILFVFKLCEKLNQPSLLSIIFMFCVKFFAVYFLWFSDFNVDNLLYIGNIIIDLPIANKKPKQWIDYGDGEPSDIVLDILLICGLNRNLALLPLVPTLI